MVGLGYRRPLVDFIKTRPAGVECLEITAEHFFDQPRSTMLAELRRDFQLFVHGLGMSLGTPGPLDPPQLERFAQVVRAADPAWISEHVAFTRAGGIDLGHLNPVPLTLASLQVLADHARELQDHCQKPLLLENITSHLRLGGGLSEPEFLNRLCERAGCGLLLDVTNLFINSRNHGYDPLAWLDALDGGRVLQMHLVGYAVEAGRLADSHASPVQSEIIDLAREVMKRGRVQAILLERDECFPGPTEMAAEMAKLRRLWAELAPRDEHLEQPMR